MQHGLGVRDTALHELWSASEGSFWGYKAQRLRQLFLRVFWRLIAR